MSPWRSLLSSLWHHINGHSYLPDARWVLRRDTPLDEQVLDLWSFRVCRCGSRKFARESGMTWAVTVKGDLSRPAPSSPFPAPTSSSSLADRLSRPAIERAARRDAASRPEWAPATVGATSHSQRAGDIESASAPSGVSR